MMNTIKRMETALMAAKDRIRELESALIEELHVPARVRMTPSERRVLGVLMSREIMTRGAALAAIHCDPLKDEPDPQIIQVHICNLRRKLADLGITIVNHFGIGWSISNEDKAAIRQAFGGVRVAAE